jgi:hypothetical protein
LEISEDSVRVEISTALNRGIRVIPVLVEGATMPEAADREIIALLKQLDNRRCPVIPVVLRSAKTTQDLTTCMP